MSVVHPLLKLLPFGKDKGGHQEGDVRAAVAPLHAGWHLEEFLQRHGGVGGGPGG